MDKPILAITMGDPASIGPEITVKALARPEIHQICRPLVVGDACMLDRARRVTGLEDIRVHIVTAPAEAEYRPGTIDVLDMRLVDAATLPIGRVSAEAGEAAFRYVEKAIALARTEGCDVLLTEIDFGGPRWEGLELAERVKGINPAVNIIFVTAFSERDYAKEVIQLRVSGFVRKPYEEKDLEREFSNLLYPPA